MKIYIKNMNWTLCFCLNILRWVGFLVPDRLTQQERKLWPFYAGFWIMFIVGIYIIVQTSELIHVWGDLTLMTDTSFLLLTNYVFLTKIFTVMIRRQAVQAIIDEGDEELRNEDRKEGKAIIKSANQETSLMLFLYVLFTVITLAGWAIGAEKNELPLRARYPYDTTKSPAYELTFIHQFLAVILIAFVNLSLDTLVTSLTAVCRCRLRFLALSLRALCDDIGTTGQLLNSVQEKEVKLRLFHCVLQHQATLHAASQIQYCFSESMLAQFLVSIIIICVTAYQLALENTKSLIRLVSMTTYLICMIIQVFLYCYQGNHLSEESSNIADAAYACPWYACSVSIRKSVLLIMTRSNRVTVLSAGGFTEISLPCFMSIIKASYSFFTVLLEVE